MNRVRVVSNRNAVSMASHKNTVRYQQIRLADTWYSVTPWQTAKAKREA